MVKLPFYSEYARTINIAFSPFKTDVTDASQPAIVTNKLPTHVVQEKLRQRKYSS